MEIYSMPEHTETIVLSFDHVRKLPVFTTSPFTDVPIHRIFGYAESAKGAAMFPAFAPAVWSVLRDIEDVFGDAVRFTPEAQAHVDALKRAREMEEALTLPIEMDYVHKPFAHQHQALCFAYYRYRCCLGLTMGLGKTKIMIDLLRLLKKTGEPHKALVLVPPHLVHNWVDQFETHAFPGEFNVISMADENNNVLSVDDRTAIYTGEAAIQVDPMWRYAVEFPNLYYEPIPAGLPAECYEVERQYVEAIVAGDAKARTRANQALNRRAIKYEFERPKGTWRILKELPDLRSADVVIMSYDIAVSDRTMLEQAYDFDVLMCDESHYLRSISSDRSKGVSKLGRRAARMVFSSGSPSAGDPQHLYRMLELICASYTVGYMNFQRRYIIKRRNGFGIAGFKNLDILNEIMGECALMMDADDCVGLDLPPLNIVDVPVALDAETRNLYNQLVEGHQAWIAEKNVLLETQYAAERITKLLQLLSGFVIDGGKDSTICDECPHLMQCVEDEVKPYTKHCMVAQTAPKRDTLLLANHPKLDVAMGLISDILTQPDSKVIVWCQFQAEIDTLAAALKKQRVGYVKVDGGSTDAETSRSKFNKDPSCRVYLSNVAISEGFTINAAAYTIYYGLTYNLVHYAQSMKRNHRIGQNKPVTVYRLYTPKTVHDALRNAIDLRQNIADTLCDIIRCGECPKQAICAAAGVKPFDEACIYNKKLNKPTTKARGI